MIDVDVLIVGGGPSGSALGFLLQKNGISTCIVEKKTFPRAKLCGGLLTQKTIDLLHGIFGDIKLPYEDITSDVRLFLGNDLISSVVCKSKFYLVDRLSFDFHLIQKYREISGLLFENSKLTEIDLSGKTAKLNNGSTIRFKIIAGADGANSQIRKFIDKKFRPNVLCLESSVKSDHMTSGINIHLSVDQYGYGWCFSKGDHYSIGIGCMIKKNKKIKESFLSFLNQQNKTAGETDVKGAVVPIGIFVKKPCNDSVILVGDAAGFVDPITGEGIYFALLSAKYAYEAIKESFINKTALSKNYCKKIKWIQDKIKDANLFNKMYFNDYIKSFLVKLVTGRKTMIRYICDHIISDYHISYTGFPFHYLKMRGKIKKNYFS